MAINLLGLQPHKVSRDLRGYSVFIYGDPKTGKTTIASQFPEALLLGFEKGWAAIDGIMVQPINTWSEFKQTLRELKKEEVKKTFSTIVIDTADIAYDYCIQYICNNAKRPDGGFGVDKIGDIPYGQGFGMVEKEFDECLRSVVQMGYGIVIISHAIDKTYTDVNGADYSQIGPTLDKRGAKVVSRMTDIIGYARAITNEEGVTSTKLFLRGTPRYVAGSRFKYTPECIDFDYQSLVTAIAEAIDKQAAAHGSTNFTNERQNLEMTTKTELNFEELMGKFNKIVNDLINKYDEETFQTVWQPKLTTIIEKYLGKGNKVNNCTSAQVEAISLIVGDLEELDK